MRSTRMSLPNSLMILGLTLAGSVLWMLHAGAWDLGRRSPILNYDTAQYAVAARELATHGRLATTFALPLELASHREPPWPLAVVQPGMVLAEALVLRLIPRSTDAAGRLAGQWARPDQQEWLLLVIPFVCFMMIATSLGLATRHLMRETVPDQSTVVRAAAGFTLGLAFLLDPEAQHFAVGPFTELPFTLGLVLAVAALALGQAALRPFLFGLLLGFAGAFRANMLWLAPLLAAGAAFAAPRERRGFVLVLVLVGFVIPLAPWWFYKWRAFGSPGWDLTRFIIWDGIAGHTWFSLYHLPSPPLLPQGAAALAAVAGKVAGNLPQLLLATMTGPRALWVAALIAWIFVARPPRAQAAAGICVLAIGVVSLLAAAASIPWLRYVFPARMLVECAGILACWGLLARATEHGVGPRMRRAGAAFVAVLALGWGAWQTIHGLEEARIISRERGTPSTISMLQIAVLMNREIPAGEPVMSNLGPELAWHARRPVIHLALRPEDMAACRQYTEFRHVVLVFRDPARAWPGWSDLVAHPVEASRDPELRIDRARQYKSDDGFTIAWLELAPPEPKLAVGPFAR
ncbi:MAG: hypothetical protein ABIS67_04530 [Candidatus Eisenbacteria bacterium]